MAIGKRTNAELMADLRGEIKSRDDRIEALEKALREIEELARQRKDAPYGAVFWNMGDIEDIARAALNLSEQIALPQKPVPPPAS